MDKPFYPNPGIGSIESLAKALDVHRDLLVDIASKVESSYTSFAIPKKSDPASSRTVCEPKHELKKLQKKINSRFLEHVQYPIYLQGGIKDKKNSRDYINNSGIHAKPQVLVNLDIKNFYPNIKRDLVVDVFQNLFAFEPGVSNLLADLTTLNGRVPQGGCCSSYLANLVFYADEYKLVQKLRKNGWRYSRLLDDITLSSSVAMADLVSPIKEIAAMCTKYGLKLNNKKTRVSHRDHGIANLHVTGVWVAHGVPKLRRHERRYVRQLVYVCEKKFDTDRCSQEYHKFWNMVSGKVAKLTRLKHAEALDLRKRLHNILPVFDEHDKNLLIKEIKTLCAKPTASSKRIGFIERVNRAHYSLGILARTETRLAKSLRRELAEKHAFLPTIKEYWS
ncbi:reverse transcriptase family protein [Massilia agilis]|uniref:RNA-directed DNA polymerase n=1 Tax=Massilia agilis TaxID=1811226 RepID=A0ABT2DCA6_9BURK|nr:reverse transcriptase family protein [Massilia agilis]MCS0808966.1 reverse transcriptase family protein [Massilia agilis]